MVEIIPASFRDLSYIAAHIRPEDREEVECQTGPLHYVDLAAMHYRDNANVALVNGNPEAAFGASRIAGDHYWTAWMWGTKRIRRAVPAIGHYVRNTMIPELLDRGAMRVEARALATHHSAQRWLEAMGATRRCDLPCFGMNGESFVLYDWTRDEVS